MNQRVWVAVILSCVAFGFSIAALSIALVALNGIVTVHHGS